MNQVEHILRNVLGIKDEAIIQKGVESSYIQAVPKGKYLCKQGDEIVGVSFLIHGMFRFFCLDSKGNEHTECFTCEQGYPVMAAVDFDAPLPITIQALENSTVLVIPATLIQQLMEDNIEVMRIYNRLLMESVTMHWETKMVLYQCDAMQRYEWFLRRYKGFIDRVPHVYIASFLGITPVTLSRLRGKKKEEEEQT